MIKSCSCSHLNSDLQVQIDKKSDESKQPLNLLDKVLEHPEKYFFFPPCDINDMQNYNGVVLKKTPKYECQLMFYPTPQEEIPSSSPAVSWLEESETDKLSEEVADYLRDDLQPYIQKLYILLKENQQFILEDKGIKYPALFRGIFFKPNKNIIEFMPFCLDIFSKQEINIFFKDYPFDSGTYKLVHKGIKLIEPIQYARLQADLDPDENLDKCEKISWNEAYYARLFTRKNLQGIAKVHRIFFYQDRNPDFKYRYMHAVIQMDFYEENLFNVIRDLLKGELSLSDKTKKSFAVQILDLLVSLEQCRVVHRDIKSENILIEESDEVHENNDEFENASLKLADFGFTTREGALKYHKGTLEYCDPRLILSRGNKFIQRFNQDTWPAGCLIWELFYEDKCPWHEDLCKNPPNAFEAVSKVNFFHKQLSKSNKPLAVFFCAFFHPITSQRWSASQLLDHLKSIGISEELTFREQLEAITNEVGLYED